MSICRSCVCSALGGQSCHVVTGTKPQSSARSLHELNHRAISQIPDAVICTRSPHSRNKHFYQSKCLPLNTGGPSSPPNPGNHSLSTTIVLPFQERNRNHVT